MGNLQNSSDQLWGEAHVVAARLEGLVATIERRISAGVGFGENLHLANALGCARAAAMLLTFGVKCPLECAADAAKKEPQ